MILSAFIRKSLALVAVLALLSLVVPLTALADCYGYGCDYNNYSYSQNYNNYPYVYHYPQRNNYPPSCTITIREAGSAYTSNNYPYGYPLLLSWSSSNANSASISPDVGSVSPNGSRIVYVNRYDSASKIYSMVVYGNGGRTSSCQTSAYYLPYSSNYYNHPYTSSYTYPNYTYPTYTYPTTYNYGYTAAVPTTYVALTQIPYTGASFGLWGDALVWLSLTLVAVFAAATLFVLRKRQFLALLSHIRRE